MKKKLLSIFVMLSMIFSMFIPISASASSVSVTIDGVPVAFNDSTGYPFVDSANRTQVPLRAAMEAYGCSVEWDSYSRTAIVIKDEMKVEVPIGTNYIYINTFSKNIDTVAVIKNNRTYIPIRAVLEAFGAEVNWNQNTKRVEIVKRDLLNINSFSLDKENYSISKGETLSIPVKMNNNTLGNDSVDVLYYWMCDNNADIFSAEWGEWYDLENGNSACDLTISALSEGTANIRIFCAHSSTGALYGIPKTIKLTVGKMKLDYSVSESLKVEEESYIYEIIQHDMQEGYSFSIESSDTSIVKADIKKNDEGKDTIKITGVSPGNAKLYLTSELIDGRKLQKQISITVTKIPEFIIYKNYVSQQVYVGKSQTLLVGSDYKGNGEVTFQAFSSDTRIAEISYLDHGAFNVYGVKRGEVYITVNCLINGKLKAQQKYKYIIKDDSSLNNNNPIDTGNDYVDSIVYPTNKMGKEPITFNTTNRVSEYTAKYPLYLYSYDGKKFLGKLTTYTYDVNGVWNKYSKYGNSYNSTSIWNSYGTYGSKYSIYSPFNDYASKPPVILDSRGKFFGYLTSNSLKRDGFTISEIYSILTKYNS